MAGNGSAWDDEDVLMHAEAVAIARVQSRAQAAVVAALPDRQARAFLRRLWEHAGSLDHGGASAPELVTEPALAADLAALLARLGIGTSSTPVDGGVLLSVPRHDDRGRFLREIVLARAGETSYGAVRPLSA